MWEQEQEKNKQLAAHVSEITARSLTFEQELQALNAVLETKNKEDNNYKEQINVLNTTLNKEMQQKTESETKLNNEIKNGKEQLMTTEKKFKTELQTCQDSIGQLTSTLEQEALANNQIVNVLKRKNEKLMQDHETEQNSFSRKEKDIKKKYEKFKTEISEMEKKNIKKETEKEMLKKENDDKDKIIIQLKKDKIQIVDDNSLEIASWQKMHDKDLTVHDADSTSIQQLEKEAKEMKKDMKEIKITNESMTKEKKKLNQNVSALNKELKNEQIEQVKSTKSIQTLKKEIETLKKLQKEKEIKEIEKVNHLQKEIHQKISESLITASKIDALNKEIQDKNEEKEKWWKQEKDRTAKHSSQVQELKSKIEQIQKKQDATHVLLIKSQKKELNAHEKLEELNNKYTVLKNTNLALTNHAVEMEENLNSNANTYAQEKKVYEANIVKSNSNIETFQKKLDISKKAFQKTQKVVVDKNEIIKNLKKDLKELTKSKNIHLKEIASANQDMEVAHNALETLRLQDQEALQLKEQEKVQVDTSNNQLTIQLKQMMQEKEDMLDMLKKNKTNFSKHKELHNKDMAKALEAIQEKENEHALVLQDMEKVRTANEKQQQENHQSQHQY